MIDIFVSHVLMVLTLLYLIFSLATMNIEKSDRHKESLQGQVNSLFAVVKKLPNADTIIMDAHEKHLTLLEKHNEKST
tara:strand:- start:3 stop:236 length:234 start_codon:yes stop_codon:yes gene_type:complete